ncbi:hypothetical protein [Hymenobacter sublimis]|uniref:Uncharacterized protein n=1 Tax=Hymenobacter sublimis TaxID=2933777 RepID=A0ABY4JEE2_9BACT|nr:hypothetical protein [Hymenobacter sublimis]UPL50328.1 hypothetical protein MWH26_05315 [Hymenobacter sublimis]
MDLTFDLNLDASFADSIRQQHTGVDAQRAITDLEDQVGGTLHQLYQRHKLLPGVGDQVQIDDTLTVVVTARRFESDGSLWFSVQRHSA